MIEVYCDGATSKNGQEGAIGGYGGVILVNGILVGCYSQMVDNTTNQKMELLAAIHALTIIEGSKTLPNDKVTIYTDSAYLYNCYAQKWYKTWQNNGWKNSKKQPVANKELWELLIPYFKNNRFIFSKVKGHSTVQGNILADELAVAGRTGQGFNKKVSILKEYEGVKIK